MCASQTHMPAGRRLGRNSLWPPRGQDLAQPLSLQLSSVPRHTSEGRNLMPYFAWLLILQVEDLQHCASIDWQCGKLQQR